MFTTRRGHDPHSLELCRDDECFGYVNWHPGQHPLITFAQPFAFLTLPELDRVLQEYGQIVKAYEQQTKN